MIEVARRGSFSAAADSVGLTQAAVSLQMKQLEDELEAELFDRSGRTPKLNANGKLALERAEQIITLYDSLPEAINPLRKVKGVLALGIIHTALTGPVPRVLARLKQEYDQLEFRIHYGLSAELAHKVEDGELDAALISELPHAPPPTCEWRPYDVERYYVVGPLDAEASSDAELLEMYPYIRFSKHAWSGAIVQGQLMARNIKPKQVMEVDSVEAALNLVEQGLGVAVAPISPVRLEKSKKRFSLIPFGTPHLLRRVGLYQNRKHPRRILTDTLYSALAEEFKLNKKL